MENTLENKAKFFAQYWGQKLLAVTVNENDFRQKIGNTYMGKYHVEMCHIELKPLSLISDAEALNVAKIFDLDESEITDTNLSEWIEALLVEPAGYLIDGYFGSQILHALDLLRSKSYALPWMGLSVEKQIDYGWVKLK